MDDNSNNNQKLCQEAADIHIHELQGVNIEAKSSVSPASIIISKGLSNNQLNEIEKLLLRYSLSYPNSLEEFRKDINDAVLKYSSQYLKGILPSSELSNSLSSTYNELAENIIKITENNKIIDNTFNELFFLIKRVESYTELQDIRKRIHSRYFDLYDDKIFLKDQFNGKKNCAVVSIDIRESTQLMLNAKSPEDFQKFINSLSNELRTLIQIEYGVYDKFTGDGILCFFPDFYSGEDSILHALTMANKAHEVFNAVYDIHRNCFSVVRADVGLGIGIDYGKTLISYINDEHTVIGTPVVYACRLSGGHAGETRLNQGVVDQITKKNINKIHFTEIECEFKNQGKMIAYRLDSIDPEIEIKDPEWLNQKTD